MELDQEGLAAFRYAVLNHYWYQMYIDDLPIWGIIGEVSLGNPSRLPTSGRSRPVSFFTELYL